MVSSVSVSCHTHTRQGCSSPVGLCNRHQSAQPLLRRPAIAGSPRHWQGPARSHRGRGNLVTSAAREQATGVEFPDVTDFWQGESFRCLGAGLRSKKFAFVPVKVYAVTLYVEAAKALKELGIRARGGFFSGPDDYASALLDGTFAKLIQVQLVRNVDGTTFYQAFEDALAPRLRMTGETGALDQFGGFLKSRNLEKGTNVLMLWASSGTLELLLAGPGQEGFAKAKPDLQVESAGLCRALFETYLGDSSVVPDAKATWAQTVQQLLQDDKAARAEKGGAG